MLRKITSAIALAAVLSTGAFGLLISKTSTAEARGFGCVINKAKCFNQLKTPKTFKK